MNKLIAVVVIGLSSLVMGQRPDKVVVDKATFVSAEPLTDAETKKLDDLQRNVDKAKRELYDARVAIAWAHHMQGTGATLSESGGYGDSAITFSGKFIIRWNVDWNVKATHAYWSKVNDSTYEREDNWFKNVDLNSDGEQP